MFTVLQFSWLSFPTHNKQVCSFLILIKCHYQRKPGRCKSSRSAFDLHLFTIEKVPEKIINGGIFRSWWVFYFKIKSFF